MPTGSGNNASFNMGRRLAAARQHEYSVVSSYKLGYRNREDITNLPAGTLIVGSQNVFTNVNDRVQLRQGYILDGATSSINAPILSSFDWQTRGNSEVRLRSGFLTSAGNDGKIQYRYVDSGSGTVTWRDLSTGLPYTGQNFTTFWRTDESLRVALWVGNSPAVYEWNGAVATINTSTSSSITINGTNTWSDAGFYATTSNRAIVINNSIFTYTGGEGTLTITGVTPDASTIVPNAVAHQQYLTTAISTFTSGPAAGFKANLISTLNNQVFLASLIQPTVFISKVNSYTDYSSSTPRQVGEGASLILDDNVVGFSPQEQFMYVTAGQDLWYNVNFALQTSTVGISYEQVNALRLKTGRRQAAISQAFLSYMKNYLLVVTKETTVDTFGRIETSLATPMTTNLSDPIKIDIDSYDFTDGSIFYHQYNIYVAVPKESIVLNYSLNTKSWSAPLTLPISRFYIVNGQLYGHSYTSSESYKLFSGYADRVYPGFNGYPIPATMAFAYQNYGSRNNLKSSDALYVEGYISANTTLNAALTYELDGCATVKNFALDGSDTQFVCIAAEEGSLGKESLGKEKLGGAGTSSLQGLPPKFRWIPTFSNTDFFESSVSFSVLGTDQNFQLLAFGLNARPASSEPVSKKD